MTIERLRPGDGVGDERIEALRGLFPEAFGDGWVAQKLGRAFDKLGENERQTALILCQS